MSEESQRLYNEGLAFLQAGERAKASDSLKRAIEEDSENVDIWIALAQALDDVDEKRIALTTILQLDPENEFAKSDLIETEKPKQEVVAETDLVPGISQREARLAGIGLAIFTLVVCGITLLFVNGQNANRDAQRASLTQAVVEITLTLDAINAFNTQIAQIATEEALASTATQLALTTATPTPTPTRSRELPTEIPPTAVASPTTVVSRILPPPPGNVSGKILAWGGRNLNTGVGNFVNLRSYDATTGNFVELNSDAVSDVTVDEANSRLVYLRAITGGVTMITVNAQNPDPIGGVDLLNQLAVTGAQNPQHPRLARSGNKMVVVADIGLSSAIFTIEFTTNAIKRITPDDGTTYTQASISPDGASVVAVKKTANGTDLVLINALDEQNAFPQTPLTTDGDTVIESAPDFGSDGALVVYSATSTNPLDSDLYLLRLSGGAVAGQQVLVSTTANETMPALSPDGNYVVFASNQAGIQNIFIYDITNRTTYQLTEETLPVFVGGWAR